MKFNMLKWIWPVVVGLAAAYAVSGWAVPVSVPPRPEAPEAVPASAAEQKRLIKDIRDRNILGLATPAPKAAAPKQAAPKVNPASWRLLGTVLGKPSYGLFMVGQEFKTLSAGQSEQGWQLTSVEPQAVVWTRGGDTQRVQLRDQKNLPAPVTVEKSVAVNLDGKKIAPYLKDPTQMLNHANFKPFREGGKVIGFRLRDIKKDSILSTIGLVDNDVLIRINGRRMDGPHKLLMAYKDMKPGTTVTVDVQRGKDVKTFLLNID